jgi:hypothetical protein
VLTLASSVLSASSFSPPLGWCQKRGRNRIRKFVCREEEERVRDWKGFFVVEGVWISKLPSLFVSGRIW